MSAAPTKATPGEIADAFAKAKHLAETLGDEHPKTFLAVIRALMLSSPGLLEQKMGECGLTMPTATHISSDGQPLYSTEAVAEALGEPPEVVAERISELQRDGVVGIYPAGSIAGRIQ